MLTSQELYFYILLRQDMKQSKRWPVVIDIDLSRNAKNETSVSYVKSLVDSYYRSNIALELTTTIFIWKSLASYSYMTGHGGEHVFARELPAASLCLTERSGYLTPERPRQHKSIHRL